VDLRPAGRGPGPVPTVIVTMMLHYPGLPFWITLTGADVKGRPEAEDTPTGRRGA
jgi:hypothetical protein